MLSPEEWCREAGDRPWRLEVLVEDTVGERWAYRRDHRISLPLDRIGIEIDGVPVVRPEIVLLYKSKGSRERDDADFQSVLPGVDAQAREWLVTALRVAGTGTKWVELLEVTGPSRESGVPAMHDARRTAAMASRLSASRDSDAARRPAR